VSKFQTEKAALEAHIRQIESHLTTPTPDSNSPNIVRSSGASGTSNN
jgi:hypothetical protein